MDVLVTLEAINDLADMYVYVEDTFGVKAADRFEAQMKGRQLKIADNPYFTPQTEHEFYGYKIYKKVYSPSLIFYIVDEIRGCVVILHILREESDWGTTLDTTDTYHNPDGSVF